VDLQIAIAIPEFPQAFRDLFRRRNPHSLNRRP
jgi:hypothetical protein